MAGAPHSVSLSFTGIYKEGMQSGYPASASSFAVNLAGGAVFLASLSALQRVWPSDMVLLSVGGIAASLLTLLAGEIFFLKSHRRERVGLRLHAHRQWSALATKVFSFNVTLAIVLACYAYMPEYHKSYYAEFHRFIPFAFPATFIIGNLYLYCLDHRLGSPDDGLLHFGYLLTGRWKKAERAKVGEYFKSVLLRAYFVPAMYIYFMASLETYVGGAGAYLAQNAAQFPDVPGMRIVTALMTAYFFLMTIDALFAVIGYLMTFKAIDADVRSTEPTAAGWISCILCYTPFFEILLALWLLRDFYHNPQWFEWFAGHDMLLIVWGALAALAMCAEAFTTMTFGIRFSNLTYRGLMSTGLFRYTKHPQYVSKMLNRFLVFVPFLSLAGFAGAVWTMLLFAGLCLLYYVRARTEENHLSIHEDYALYAGLMNERSVFAPLARLLPFLRYSREKALCGRLF